MYVNKLMQTYGTSRALRGGFRKPGLSGGRAITIITSLSKYTVINTIQPDSANIIRIIPSRISSTLIRALS